MKKFLVIAALCFLFCMSAMATPACIEGGVDACIGSSQPCRPCYERPGRLQNTVEKAVVASLNAKLVARDYANTALYLDEDVVLDVPAFGVHLEGRTKVVGYFALGDPAITDTYELINSTLIKDAQEDLNLISIHSQYLKSVQTGNVFNQQSGWNMQFSAVHQISYWVIYPDSLAVANNLLGTLDLDPNSICTTVQSSCTGPNEQYADQAACVAFMTTLPPIDPTFGLSTIASQASYGCRSFHLKLALIQPEIHCNHVGPLQISPVATPCFNWQLILS